MSVAVRLLPPMLALALTVSAGPAALAHAFLDHAEPRVGGQVRAAAQVRLWFTQSVVPAFCHVTVTGPPSFGGAGPVHALPGQPQGLAVDLRPPVPAGDYVVRWRVLSIDTHQTEGAFSFRVLP